MRLLLFCLSVLAAPAMAGPDRFILDVARSEVGFTYDFQGAERVGAMPVISADMRIDLDNVPASSVTVTLDPGNARAGFIFATQVMKGSEVLDTANHPTIRFRSTGFHGDLRGATVTGDLTVRGVTRPVILQAGLFRQRGTDVGERDNLTVLLTGSINRKDYGAGGFPGYIGPMIDLRVMARITRATN